MPTNETVQSDTTTNYTVSSTIRNSEVRTVMLYGVPIIALIMDGVERLCLAQISNTLLKNFSYNEIHNRRVALGITCIQCTPVQLELLRRAGAMPVSSRRCGMITKREAERLCKSFLAETQPPKLPENFAFDIYHHCSWGCKGSFMPSRYNSSRAKCIKCTYCGLFFSPNKFIFHSHQLPSSKYVQPDAANFNSWRRHIKLAGNPSEDVCLVWEDVKAMFNGGSRKRAMSCGLSSGGGASASNNPTSQHHQSSSSSSSSSNQHQHYDKKQRLESPINSIESTPTPPHHPSNLHPHHLHSLPPPTSSSQHLHHHHRHVHPHLSHHVHPNSLLDPSLIKGLNSAATGSNCLPLSSLPVKPSYALPVPTMNGPNAPVSSSLSSSSTSTSSRQCLQTDSSRDNTNSHLGSHPPPQPLPISSLCSTPGGKNYNGTSAHLSPVDFRSSFADLMTWSSGGGLKGSSNSSTSPASSSSWSIPYGCVFWPRSPATAAVAAAAAAAAAASSGSGASNRLPNDLLYPVMDATAVAAAAAASATSSSKSSSISNHNIHSPHASLSDASPHHPHHWLMPIEAAASSSFLLSSAAAAAVSQSRSLMESSPFTNGQGSLSHISAFKPINITNKSASSLSSSKHNNSVNQILLSSSSMHGELTPRLKDDQLSPIPIDSPANSPVNDVDDVNEPSTRISPSPSDTEADVIDVIGNDEGDDVDEGEEEVEDEDESCLKNTQTNRYKKTNIDEVIKKEPSVKLTWRQEMLDKNTKKEISNDFDKSEANERPTKQSTGLMVPSNLALDLSNMGSISKGDDLNRLMLNGSESRQRLEKELELMQNLVLNGPYKCNPASGYSLIGDDQGRSAEQLTRDEMHKRLQFVSLLKLNQLNYYSS
ncbi:SKI family transcriptional corepressor 1-like [Tetranychus urticae]|nr:SKI family transcriptional corepressor 1-like [Tetranychus urticae]